MLFVKGELTAKPSWACGDSALYPDLLSKLKVDVGELKKAIEDQCPFVDRNAPEMAYRGNAIKRSKAFLVDSLQEMKRYSYPGWQWNSMWHYGQIDSVACGVQLRDMFQGTSFGGLRDVRVNHMIFTKYEQRKDGIGRHRDHKADITPASPIVLLSFGDSREFVLSDKDEKEIARFVVEAGDVFILGPETNEELWHEIVPIHKEKLIPREVGADGLKRFGTRISVVLRDIHTVVTRDELHKKCTSSSKTRARARAKKEEKRLSKEPGVKRKREEGTVLGKSE